MRQFGISHRLVTTEVCRFGGRSGQGHRGGVSGRRRGPGGVFLAAVLAAASIPALSPSVALASSPSVLTWTQQSPATSPTPRTVSSMAYDAATGTTVLFGGENDSNGFASTWAWDGSTWTKQSPANSPPARADASMAYDAATGTIVLFGGCCAGRKDFLGATWTWNGSTWTKQSPATRPPAREDAAMAYDAATGNVVLFGGSDLHGFLNDTWTWDGSTWTEQAPATSPPIRGGAPMAYDAATGTTVLFGGVGAEDVVLGDTWTWGG
jgi:hypothetical protein